MKRFMILALTILFISIVAIAQEPIAPTTPIPPPAGYMDSCTNNTLMLEHFGPNCLNPVSWDLPGMPRIGTWLTYAADNGIQVSGMLLGFSWQFMEVRYYYYVMRPLNNSIFPFSFEVIAPERVIQ